MIVLMIAYLLFVHLVLLIPGYTLVKKCNWLKGKPGLELSASYVVSIFTLAILAVGGYVFSIPRWWLHSLSWVLIAFGVYFFCKQRLYRDLLVHRLPLLALTTMTVFSCAFMSLQLGGSRPFFPDPVFRSENNYQTLNVKVLNVAHTRANDNYIPYRQAQFMINRSDPAKDSFIDEWGVHFFQRTPLLGAVSAQFFTLLGDTPPVAYLWAPNVVDADSTYAKFQIIGQVMNSLFILPAFFLLTRLFNFRTATATLLFIVPSTFFLYNSIFTWPKSLVAFFILFSWLLLFEKRLRYLMLAGIVSGLAYMAHDLAVLYIGASVLLLAYWRRFRDLFWFTSITIVFFIPWLITSAIVYKKPSTFPLYPFSLHGIPQVGSERGTISDFFHTSPFKILWIKIHNLLYMISPYQLFTSEGGQSVGVRIWALALFNVSGAIGLGLIFPVILATFKKMRDLPFWILAIVPIILCTLLIGWPKGLGALHYAQASVVLFMGLGVSLLVSLKNKWWVLAAYAINCAHLIYFGLYSYNFQASIWLRSPSDLLLALVLLGIIGICGYGLFCQAQNKNLHWLPELTTKS